MQHYRIERVIGDGSFGSVVSARHIPTNTLVAIKNLKRAFPSFDDAMREREVQALLSLQPHPHVVALRAVIYERQQLNLVFEHVQGNLLQWLRALSRPLPQHSIQHIVSEQHTTGCVPDACWCRGPIQPDSQSCCVMPVNQMFQLLSAIAHVHQAGVFHRDIKPENLLLQLDNFVPSSAQPTAASSSRPASRPSTSSAAYLTPSVKLADFGQARDIRSRPPYSEYVSTRWYRAPEQLLHSTAYNSPIDVWAAGCIMAELHTLTPLFGGSNEVDTLQRIAQVVPQAASSADGQRSMRPTSDSGSRGAAVGSTAREGLRRSVSGAGEAALDLMAVMLRWDPKSRVSARDALLHPFFDGVAKPSGREEEERKEAMRDEYGQANQWDSCAADGEDAQVQVSADGKWLTANNQFGELRCRYFPPQPSTDTAPLRPYSPTEQQEDSGGSITTQHHPRVTAVSAMSGFSTTAAKLDWPSFSDDSDDDDEPTAPTRSSLRDSRSVSSSTSNSNLYTPLSDVSPGITSSGFSTRSPANNVLVPPVSASNPSRPSSVLSTHRSRRSFASVGSLMFSGT